MAIKTQLRLGQQTGSLGDFEGGIIDGRPAQNVALTSIALNSGSMVGVMSEVVSSIQRLHNHTSFAGNLQGEFNTTIQPSSDDGFALGSSNKNWSDLFLADGAVINLGDDQDVKLTHVHDTGVLLNSTSQLQFNDNGTFIHSDADGKLKISADGTASDSINIDSAGGVDVDAADDIALTTTSADGEIQLVSAHTAGRAIFLDGNAAAGSIVDIDAGILQIDVTDSGHIQTGGQLDIATANSVAVNIGNGTSTVTIGDNLVVSGDLTVSGDTVQQDVSKLTVEDSLIELNRGIANNVDNLDIGFVGKYGDSGTHKYAGLFRDANDEKFHLFKDTEEDLAATNTINKGATGYTPATLVADIEGSSTLSVVTDSTANTLFPVVFHDEANALLDSQFIEISPGNKKLQFTGGDAADIAELSVDANASFTIKTTDAAGAAAHIVLDHDGSLVLNAATNTYGTFSRLDGDFSISPVDAQSILFSIVGGSEGVGFVDGNTGDGFGHITGSSEGLILSGAAANDILFKTNRSGASEEIARFDSSVGSFHMADNRPLEFGEAGENIFGDGTRLLINSSEDIRLDAAEDILLDSDSFAYRFNDGGTERLVILKDGSDHHIKIQSEIQDKDVIISVNDGGSPGQTVATFTGATRHLVLNTSNNDGTVPGLLAFASDLEEAVFGDGSNLYLRSGNQGFKIPSSDGLIGEVLQTDGNGNLSFAPAGGASSALKVTGTVDATAGLAAGSALSSLSTFTGFDNRALDGSLAKNALDVFVNGQLLLSCSSGVYADNAAAYDANTSGDYLVTEAFNSATSGDVKFTFDLEKDDVVVVSVRG